MSTTTAAVVAAAALLAVSPPSAQAAPARAAAPASAYAAAGGATVPFTTLEAESASTNGSRIGPDYTQGTLASEASGRQAVRLDGQGKYVEFTLTRPANAVNVAYSVPDGRTGTLSVYVNGAKISRSLAVTAKYSYVDTGWIAGSKTHKLYDHARVQLGSNLGVGAKVRLQVDAADTAGPYTIDDAEFEQVAGPAGKPAGAISVTDRGADASGQADSTNAFNQAISDARAAGAEVWIPQGDFKVPGTINADNVTVRGAGQWYSVVHGHHLIDRQSATGNTKFHNFAVIGEVTERNDGSPDNFVQGALGRDSVVSGMWFQHLKVGLWLTGVNDNLIVENNRFYDMTADGLNLNGTANNIQVRNNFLRNTGDDALAMWSLNAANRNSTFADNTIVQPTLANGIAIYGGTDITVRDNVVADTNALGSGIAISNQAFLQPFFPLAGTITVSGNTTIRAGAMNPNWNHPMGAVRVDPYDTQIDATVRITNTTIQDSPYSAFEFVSGSGRGLAVRNTTVDGATVQRTGTVVVQAETQGSATFNNVVASNVGAAGVYNCPYPSGTFTLNRGPGNNGWDSTWNSCSTWPAPGGGNPGPDPTGNLALNRPATAAHTDVYVPANAVDGNASTYWESPNNAFPQNLTVDLGSTQSVKRLVLKLPPATAWSTRTQTLSVLGSTDGSGYSTVAASRGYTFDPATGNTVTITLPSAASTRYLRLNLTANTGWPAGQLSEFEAYAS